jgi:hypothetical protein
MKRALKKLAWSVAPALYRRALPREGQEFSIGIAVGDSPFALRSPPGIENPVLARGDVTDVPAGFVADPFMWRRGDRWYLFFEVVNHLSRKGEIGLAVSRDALVWEYQRIVLAEPFHLSYPYVFEWDGEHYMVPEGARGKAVVLYRALDFPYRWQRAATLLEGQRYADSSLLFFRDRWWLFTDAGLQAADPTLRLFSAEELLGPWREHPCSPILQGDRHFTRPAGRIIVVEGRPVRFAQDIYPVYGSSVSAFAITNLTPSEYGESRIGDRPILGAGSEAWNRHGMHHVDAHSRGDGSWIACVDGFQRNS